MTDRFDGLAARAAPALFVLLWSTGFIGTKYALEGAEPFTMLALRMLLIRHSAATRVASLFYLVPGVTALMAYALFDERLDALSIAGMVVCAAGVVLVNRR